MKTSHSTMWKWCAGLSLALGLCIAAPQVQAQYAGEGTFTKITSLADLTEGYYVIARSNGTPAMKNVNAGTFFATNTISPVADTLTDPDASIVWLIETNATYGGLTLFNEASNKYVSYSGTANAAYAVDAVNGTTGVWKFSYASGVFAAANVAASTRVLQYNVSTPRFAVYSSSQAKFALYKMEEDAASAPAVTTVAASGIGADTATGNGDVTDDGGDTVTERGVVYKTSAGVAITDNPTAAAAGGTGEFSVDLSSLSVNQIYYFRAYAENSVDTTLAANELSFTTLANVPSAPTVDNPTATTLDVAVNANGNPAATEFAIQRTSDDQYLQADGSFGASEDWQTAAEWDTTTATGLASETEYFFQVKARNGANVETAFGSTAGGTTAAAPTGIWINPMSAGTPMATYYLGDVMGEFFVNFEIGQASWDYVQVGLGTSVAGAGYNWGVANWYEDGEGSNKRVRRNLNGYQFTATGSHYVICQAKANSWDAYTSKSGNGWGNSQAYPPADLASAYFAVSALNDPSGQSAEATESTQINLLWSQDAQSHNVMIVRKLAAASWTEPTPGTSYSASDTLGAGTVIYNGNSTAFNDTGLEASTTYDYKFYSVNGGYYSAGVTAQEATLACEPDAPTGLYASATNETSFTAAWTASARATGYRLDVSESATFSGEETAEPIFTETMGTVAATTTLLAHETADGFDNDAYTMSNAGVTSTGDVRATSSSSGYASASGAANIWFPSTAGSYGFGIVGIDASGYDSLQLSFGYRKESASANATFAVEYSTDGSTWIPVTVTGLPAENAATGWYLISDMELPPAAVSATFQLRWAKSGSVAMRIDDVVLQGVTAAAVFVDGYENLAVAGTSQLVEGLSQNTTYYFRVRAEGAGGCPGENSETASVTTLEEVVILPQARNTSGGAPEAPAAITLGDTGQTFGFDSWGTLDSNWGAARLWRRYDNADLAGGTASDWTAFTDSEHKTVDSGVFDQVGTWYWGLQMDYGAEYGTAYWYKAASADWVDMSTAGAGASLTVTVSAINDAADQTATRSTTAPASAIDLTWSKNAQGHDVMVVRKLSTDSWTEPTPAAAYGASDSIGAGTVVYNGSDTSVSATGLAGDMAYDFKFYSVNNDYYSAGVTAQASTAGCAPAAPTGLDAVADYTDITASWEAVTGATGYRLDVSTAEEFGTSGLASDLIISEYFEGVSGNNKAIEIYNGTGAAVDLSDYRLWMISNGGDWPETTNILSGTLAAGDVYVFTHSLSDYANLTTVSDGSSSTLNFNGDDAVGLAKDIDGTWTLIDAVGEAGADPGDGWTVAGTANATKDHSLIRKSTVTGPTTDWTVSRGTSTEDSQWIVSLGGTNEHAADFGSHTFDGGSTPSFVAGYSNLAVAGTSQLVEGLDEDTTYYFRVRAEGEGGCPSVNSATANATTLLHLRAVLSSSAVNVREAGEGRFFVRLNQAPEAAAVVGVSRSAGDESLAVQSGATLTFSSTNWSAWQVVTLAQAADGNADNEAATMAVSLAGVEDQTVTATALDDDIGENLALASGGSLVSGTQATKPEWLIDGVHLSSANYGYTTWTNLSSPGTITVDLRAAAVVSRIRLLNWDWGYRTHQYKIESSLNGTDWSSLVDASAGAHRGWEDWDAADRTARYLRFTGLSNSANQYVALSELELYGSRDLSGLPQLEVSRSSVNVRENGEGRFFVRLDRAPEAVIPVSVDRSAGDESLTVQSGAALAFGPTNWSFWQAVTLAAPEDGNAVGETATIRVSAPAAVDQSVTATTLDDDIGENLALASGGSTISGTMVTKPEWLIDGVHTSSANYGYTYWTNEPPGRMTLDLKAATTVSRIRLLNWDWSHRTHQYRIEGSLNGSSWTTLVDADASEQRGWEDWTVDNEPTRYLRFTGVSNSANRFVCVAELEVYGAAVPPPQAEVSTDNVNVREAGEGRFYVRLDREPLGNVTVGVTPFSGDAGLTVKSGATRTFTPANWSTWQVVTLQADADANADNETATFRLAGTGLETGYLEATALDDDIGTNWALALNGGTIAGSPLTTTKPAWLIDGVHLSSANYGYTFWTNDPPGTMTLDLQEATTVSRIRLLNWDWGYRTHQYRIESSLDGAEWTTLVDADTSEQRGWEDWAVAAESIRYLRFTGVSNSANRYVCIAEWEVYGERTAGRRSLAPAKGGAMVAESEPATVVTSDDVAPDYESGWAAVDGDPETAWVGQKVGGGYILVGYEPTLRLKTLEVDMAEGSLTGIQYLYSLDAQDWQPLPEDMEAHPVSLNFLWLVFPDDGTEAVPEVFEIRPNP